MQEEKKNVKFHILSPQSDKMILKVELEHYEVELTQKSTEFSEIYTFEQFLPFYKELSFEFITQYGKLSFKRRIEKDNYFEVFNFNTKLIKINPLVIMLEYLIKYWFINKKNIKISNFIDKVNSLIQDSKIWELSNVNLDVNNAINTTLTDFLCRIFDFRDSVSFCTYLGLLQQKPFVKLDSEKLQNLIITLINKNPTQDLDEDFIYIKDMRCFETGLEYIILQDNLNGYLKVLLNGCLNFMRLELKVPLFTLNYQNEYSKAIEYLFKNLEVKNPKMLSSLIKFAPTFKSLEDLMKRMESKFIQSDDLIQKIHEFDQDGNEMIRQDILNLLSISNLQNEEILHSFMNTRITLNSNPSFLSSLISKFSKSIKSLSKSEEFLQGFRRWILKNVTDKCEFETFLIDLNEIIEKPFIKEHQQRIFEFITLSPYFLESSELELLRDITEVLSKKNYSQDLENFFITNCTYIRSLIENEELFLEIFQIINQCKVQREYLLEEFFDGIGKDNEERFLKNSKLVEILKSSNFRLEKLKCKFEKIIDDINNSNICLNQMTLIKLCQENFIKLLDIFKIEYNINTIKKSIKDFEDQEKMIDDIHLVLTNYFNDFQDIEILMIEKKEENMKVNEYIRFEHPLLKYLTKDSVNFLSSFKDSILFKSIWKSCLKEYQTKLKLDQIFEHSTRRWNALFDKFDKKTLKLIELIDLEVDYQIIRNRGDDELKLLSSNQDWFKIRSPLIQNFADLMILKKYSSSFFKVMEFLNLSFDYKKCKSYQAIKWEEVDLSNCSSYNCNLFKHLNQSHLEFIEELSKNEQIFKWLLKYPLNDEFDKLLEIYSDDLRVNESKEALRKLREFLRPFLYSNYVLKNLEIVKGEIINLKIEKDSLIQILLLVKRNFKLLSKLFEEKTRSQGVEALYELKEIIEEGSYSFKSIGIISCLIPKKNTKTFIELEDLRNQIFLIDIPSNQQFLNFEKDLQGFKKQISILGQIKSLIEILYHNGYFEYQKFEFEIKVKNSEENLKEKMNQLKNEVEKWDQLLIQSRKDYYYMNLFSSVQIMKIYKFLENDEYGIDDIYDLFKIGNLNLSLEKKQSIKDNWKKNQCIEEKLSNVGKSLNEIYQKVSISFREINPTFITKESENVNYLQRLKNEKFCVITKHSIEEIIETIISIYSLKSRIPEPEEILICTEQTTLDELRSFLYLWLNAKGNERGNMIYCIGNFEKLSYHIQSFLSKKIQHYLDGDKKKSASLCLISGSEDHFITNFTNYNVEFKGLNNREIKKVFREISNVYCSEMTSFTSKIPFEGKTHQIQRRCHGKNLHYCRIIINQDTLEETMIKTMKCHKEVKTCYHLDINQFSSENFNINLFKLLYLGVLKTKESERVFLRENLNYFYIESASKISWEFNFLQYIPNEIITCSGPLFDLYKCKLNKQTHKIEIRKNHKIQIVVKLIEAFKKGRFPKLSTLIDINDMDIDECFFKLRHYIYDNTNYANIQSFVNILHKMFMEYISIEKLYSKIRDLPVIKYKEKIHTFIDLIIYSCANVVTNLYENYPIIFFTPKGNICVDIILQNSSNIISKGIKELQSLNFVKIHDKIIDEEAKNLFRRLTKKDEIDEKNSFFMFNNDNTKKSILLYLKIENNIPVILCGNTGNGKREILEYISSLFKAEFQRLSIHSGHSVNSIENWIKRIKGEAEWVNERKIFIFFDMVNSFYNVDIFKQYICERVFENELLPDNVIICASCHPMELIKSQIQTIYPLPQSLEKTITNYGKLSSESERTYIKDIIKNKFPKEFNYKIFNLLTEMIHQSQLFMKENGNETYSLRAVRLTIKTFDFFVKFIGKRENQDVLNILNLNLPKLSQKSVVLSLCYSYYCRIQSEQRKSYLSSILKNYKESRNDLFIGELHFESIFEKEQQYYKENMVIPENISINDSLKENLFMILISTLIKNPIIISGLSGTSKSLAVDILASNLNGTSNSEFLKSLPSIEIFRYQCTPQSKFESIQKMFEAAKKFQKNVTQNTSTILLLNEVGLLKNLNPLKIIQKEIEENNYSISLLGLSNSKINSIEFYQAIVIYRPPPPSTDLRNTISKMITSKSVSSISGALTKAYTEFYENDQERKDFYALRDFYYLIKFINRNKLCPEIVVKGIMRNFGGKENDTNKLISKILNYIGFKSPKESDIPSLLTLIKENLNDTNARNLMIFTESYNSALTNLFNYIIEKDQHPFVIFKSEFKNDGSSDVYLYSNIQKIKKFMSQGRKVVIIGYDEIYETLFELFNMQYIEYDDQRSVYLSVGNHSKLCTVHKDFRVIIIAEKDHAFKVFKSPFLNKFEKQNLNKQKLLNLDQIELEKRITKWIKHFEDEKPFVGFNNEFISSLVLSLTSKYPNIKDQDELFEKAINLLLYICTTDGVVRLGSKYFDIYFNQQRHNNLKSVITYCFENKNEFFVNGLKLEIITYSPSYTPPNELYGTLKDLIKDIHFISLNSINSEEELIENFENFYKKDIENSLMIIQCDINSSTMLKLLHTKYLCEAIQKKYKNVEKNVIFLVHIHPGKQFKYTYHFDSIWKGIFVDDLRDLSPNIQELLFISLHDLLSSRNIKDYLLKNENFKSSLNMLSYSEVDHNKHQKIVNIRHMIENEEIWKKLREILIYTTTKLFSRESNSHWCEYVATKAYKEIIMNGSFQESILASIFKMISKSFAFLLSKMDKYSNLSVLTKSNTSIWLNLLENIKQDITYVRFETFEKEIIGVPSDQFKSFQCKYPFSFIIINSIEKSKSYFEKEKEEKLPKYIENSFPDINKFDKEEHKNNYFHDLIYMYGPKCTELDQSQQMTVINMILNFDKKIESISDMHLSLWKQQKRILIYFNILESLSKIKTQFFSKLTSVKSILDLDIYFIDKIFENCDPNQQKIDLTIEISDIFEQINISRTHVQQLLLLIQDKEIRRKQESYWKKLLLFIKLCSLNSSYEKSLSLWNNIKDKFSSEKTLNQIRGHVKQMDVPNSQNIELLYDDYFSLVEMDHSYYETLKDMILNREKYQIRQDLFNSIFRTLLSLKNEKLSKDFKKSIQHLLSDELNGKKEPEMIPIFILFFEKRMIQSRNIIDSLNKISPFNKNDPILTLLSKIIIIRVGMILLIRNLTESLLNENGSLNHQLIHSMQNVFHNNPFLQKLYFKYYVEYKGLSFLFALKNQMIEYFPWIKEELDKMKSLKMFVINRLYIHFNESTALKKDFIRIFYNIYLNYSTKEKLPNIKNEISSIELKYPTQAHILKGFINNSFKNDGGYFSLNTKTEPPKILLVGIIGQICAFAFSYKIPIFTNLLISPKRLFGLYLPSMSGIFKDIISNLILYKCKNEHTISIDFCQERKLIKCPKCNTSLTQIHDIIDNDDNLKGYVFNNCNQFLYKTERKLSPLSYRILRFIIHTLIFLGASSSDEYLEDFSRLIPSINYNFTSITFFKYLIQDWEYLCEILGKTPEDVSVLIIVILEKIEDYKNLDLRKREDRDKWEEYFLNDVQYTLSNLKIEKLNQDLFKNTELKDLYSQSTSFQPIDSHQSLIWKYHSSFTYEDFIRMFYMSENRNNYPLIDMFIQENDTIIASGSINTVLNWFKIVSTKLNGKIDRMYTREHSIRDFIESFPSDEKLYMRKLFYTFQETFNYVLPQLRNFGCEKLPRNMENFKLTEDSPITFCIPDDRDEYIYPLSFIRFLVDKHNELINKSQEYHPNQNEKKFISSQYISETHLFNMDIKQKLFPFIEGNVQIKDKLTTLELKTIDEYIFYEYFYGKIQIKLELQTFIFINELKSDGIIADKVVSKIPQIEIEKEKKIKLENRLETKEKAKKYLNEIETCCYFISSTLLIDPKASEKKIITFLKDYLSIDSDHEIYQDLTLNYIINLWKTLESYCYSYEDLDNRFKSAIPEDLKKGLIQLIPKEMIPKLVQILKEFMIGYLIHSDINQEISFKEVLRELLLPNESDWIKQFPNDLTLTHFYKVLQLLEEFLDQN